MTDRPAPITFFREVARNRRSSWLLVEVVAIVLDPRLADESRGVILAPDQRGAGVAGAVGERAEPIVVSDR